MASQGILEQKRAQVDAIKERISNAQGLVIINYSGLTVEEDTAFRKNMREAGVEYSVLKNRLVQKAFNELGFTEYDEALNGPTAIAFSNDDCIVPAKQILDGSKDNDKIEIKCGMAEGKFMDAAGVKALGALGSKKGLIAKMLGSMQAPISKFAVCIKQIAEAKAE